MAATTGTIFMRGASGRKYTLGIYNAASGAAGTYILCDYNQPATSTSPNFFTVPEVVDLVDFIPTAATGMVEFTSNGQRTGVVLDYSAWGATNPGRPIGALPRLSPGTTYRLLVISALAA